MRFMMLVKADKNTEAGVMPEEKLIAEMTRYNEELAKAGVLLDLAGLQPSSNGARVKFSPGGTRTVVDGPFAKTDDLIAGYWLIRSNQRMRQSNGPNAHPLRTATERKARSRFANCSSWRTSARATRSTASANWIRSSLRRSSHTQPVNH